MNNTENKGHFSTFGVSCGEEQSGCVLEPNGFCGL